MSKTDYFDQLAMKWPSAWVARKEVARFTGGVLSGKTLANLTSKGESVPVAIRVGNKVAYDVVELIDWLRQHRTKVEKGN